MTNDSDPTPADLAPEVRAVLRADTEACRINHTVLDVISGRPILGGCRMTILRLLDACDTHEREIAALRARVGELEGELANARQVTQAVIERDRVEVQDDIHALARANRIDFQADAMVKCDEPGCTVWSLAGKYAEEHAAECVTRLQREHADLSATLANTIIGQIDGEAEYGFASAAAEARAEEVEERWGETVAMCEQLRLELVAAEAARAEAEARATGLAQRLAGAIAGAEGERRVLALGHLLAGIRDLADEHVDGAPDAGPTATLANVIISQIDGEAEYGLAAEAVARLQRERDEAQTKLTDATAFCSGEFPCEASTTAASLERELNECRTERDEARAALETEEQEHACTERLLEKYEYQHNAATNQAVKSVLGPKMWSLYWGPELEGLCHLVDRAFNDRDAARRLLAQSADALLKVIADRDAAGRALVEALGDLEIVAAEESMWDYDNFKVPATVKARWDTAWKKAAGAKALARTVGWTGRAEGPSVRGEKP